MCSVTFLWVQYTNKSEKKELTRRQKVRTFLPGIPDSWSHWRRHFRSAHFCPDLFSQQLWDNCGTIMWHKFNIYDKTLAKTSRSALFCQDLFYLSSIGITLHFKVAQLCLPNWLWLAVFIHRARFCPYSLLEDVIKSIVCCALYVYVAASMGFPNWETVLDTVHTLVLFEYFSYPLGYTTRMPYKSIFYRAL